MKVMLANFFIRVRNLVVHEFPLLLGVALAAAAAASATPALIVPAVLAALLRFVVSPAFEAAAVKEKVLDPKVIAQVEAYLAVRDAAQAQSVVQLPRVASPADLEAAKVAVVVEADGSTFTPAAE